MNINEVIPKKRKKINKNGWMCRLYKYSLGKPAKFSGYCPLFWTTWILILCFPFILIGKSFEYSYKLFKLFLGKHAEDKLSHKEEQGKKYVQAISCKKPKDEEIVEIFEAFVTYKIKPECLTDLYIYIYTGEGTTNTINWIRQNPDWKKFYSQAKKNVEDKKALNQKRAEREKVRHAKIEEYKKVAVKYLSYLMKVLIFGIPLILGYLFFKATSYSINNITFGEIFSTIKFVSIVLFWMILSVSACNGLVFSTKWLFNKFYKLGKVLKEEYNKEDEIKIYKPSVFVKICEAIGEAYEFICDSIKIAYKKECPLIEWTEDETGPIEKNVKSE